MKTAVHGRKACLITFAKEARFQQGRYGSTAITHGPCTCICIPSLWGGLLSLWDKSGKCGVRIHPHLGLRGLEGTRIS